MLRVFVIKYPWYPWTPKEFSKNPESSKSTNLNLWGACWYSYTQSLGKPKSSSKEVFHLSYAIPRLEIAKMVNINKRFIILFFMFSYHSISFPSTTASCYSTRADQWALLWITSSFKFKKSKQNYWYNVDIQNVFWRVKNLVLIFKGKDNQI